MANTKISDLTAITGANLAVGDLYVLADVSESETKKITFSELRNIINRQQFPSKAVKTAAYSVLVADVGIIIELGALNAADRIFTLPSVGAADDGLLLHFQNDSYYVLTIAPSDSDHVWNSGAGYGIELPEKGTFVSLRYDHAQTKWDIVRKIGGKVLIEGLVLHEPMTKLNVHSVDLSTSNTRGPDLTNKYEVSGVNNILIRKEGDSKFLPGCLDFGGVDEYLKLDDSTDWDIFGDQTGHKTVAGWFFTDTVAASAGMLVSHYEGAGEKWNILRSTANLRLVYSHTGGDAGNIDLSVAGIIVSTWHHFAVVISGAAVGLYLDGSQIAYTATWGADTLTGSLYVGQEGGAANYLDGRMQDLHISYNNPYGAVPNATPDDTFTVPAAPFQGVMN